MDYRIVERKRKKKGRPTQLDLLKRRLRPQNQNQQKKPNPSPYLHISNTSPSFAADDDNGSPNGKSREKTLKTILIPNFGIERDDGDQEKGECDNSSKGADVSEGEPSNLGPTTPLPDKELLVFILDRLQKKDTHGFFLKPLDPENVTDYHDEIEHPMDFGTVREKLSSGSYANLEQFENDVFLISSNAMQYNEPHTIFYRQARVIKELAKKDFENLRQESDDSEPETEMVVRSGRPPSKSRNQIVGSPPAVHSAPDLSRSGPALDRRGIRDVSGKHTYNLRQTASRASMRKLETNEENSGYQLKEKTRNSKNKSPVTNENNHNSYDVPQLSSCAGEPSIFTALDGEKKQLMHVALLSDHAYARSLARFASELGPVGWVIVGNKIEKLLPPGTMFGRGWVDDTEISDQFQPPPNSTVPSLYLNGLHNEDFQSKTWSLPTSSATNPSSGPRDLDTLNPSESLNPRLQPIINNTSWNVLPSLVEKMLQPTTSRIDAEKEKFQEPFSSSWSLMHPTKQDCVSPYPSVRIESPGSPILGVVVDTDQHQPDLFLQL